jgi:hypothetical protein
MGRLIGFLSLAGFALALVVHALSLNGVDVVSYFPAVWVLHIGIFAVWGPFVFSSLKTFGGRPRLADIRAAFPAWVIVAEAAVFVYAGVNFLLMMKMSGGGSASLRDGAYVLEDHGRLIRLITQAEYTAFQANELRGFSGHWLLFYFMPFAFFVLRKRNEDPADPSAGRPGPAAVEGEA